MRDPTVMLEEPLTYEVSASSLPSNGFRPSSESRVANEALWPVRVPTHDAERMEEKIVSMEAEVIKEKPETRFER